MKLLLSLCCASLKLTALSEVVKATVPFLQGKATMHLSSTHCGKQRQATPLTAKLTTAATPLPLENSTVTHQATQSSEMPLMEIPAILFRGKTLTMTLNLIPVVHHSPGGNRLIPTAAPPYPVLLHPLDRPQMAAGQLLSLWRRLEEPATSDQGLVDMAMRIAANPLMKTGPPTAHGAPLLHLRFKCGGTPPPRVPWSPQSRASGRWGLQDVIGRSMP